MPQSISWMIVHPGGMKRLSTVHQARAASSPWPNRDSYRFYKSAPDVLRFFVETDEGGLPHHISQFHHISLLNGEGKIFFSIFFGDKLPALADSLSLQKTIREYICAKGRNPRLRRVFGAHKHDLAANPDSQKIWKRSPYRVPGPCQCLQFSSPQSPLDCIQLLQGSRGIHSPCKSLFLNIQLCLINDVYTTAWQRLEIGIMAGCTISPLTFTMAMEVIIQASWWVVGREKFKPGLRLPPTTAYMDDMTTLTTTKTCASWLLEKSQENIEWARMKIKPSKDCQIIVCSLGKNPYQW